MNYKLIGVVLWGAVLVALWAMYQNRSKLPAADQPGETSSADADEGQTTVTIPRPQMTLADFELTNTQGETVTKADLLGRPTVVSFVFSRCISTCRPITLEMKKLHDKLADHDVRFVSITVDPDFDTVEHFGAFAEIYSPDYDRWQFLTGSKKAIYDMIQGGFQLTVVEMFGVNAKPGMEVTHTERVVLLNSDGVPVKTYLILNDADRAKLIRVLEGKDDFPQPPTPGEVTMQTATGETQQLSTASPAETK